MNKTNKKTKQVGNGEGSLYYSDTLKCWVYQYHYNGKRTTLKQRKKETVKDFKARVAKLKTQLNDGTHVGKSLESISSILEQYINSKFADGIISGRSYKREMDTLKQIERICKDFYTKPIQKVTIRDIESIKEDVRNYKDSSICKIWRLLNIAFEIASSPSRQILNINIMLDISLKKPISKKNTKDVESLTEDERNKLLSILDNEEKNHKYKGLVKMQLISGMRIGEVLSRSISDYDEKTKELNIHNTLTTDEKGRIIIGEHTKTYNKKTGKDDGQRYLPLNTPLFHELIEIIEEQRIKKITNIKQLLFWNYEKNRLINYNDIDSWLERINKKYKICKDNLSSHRLRHTAITHWRNIDVPHDVIQYLAGHTKNSKTTNNVYIDDSLDYVKNKLKKIVI